MAYAQNPLDIFVLNIDSKLVIAIIVREIVLILLGSYLMLRWLKAEKRFFTDFPFLMAVTTFILFVAKLYDLYLFNYFGDLDLNAYFIDDPNILWLAKARWLLMLANVVPMISLLLSIWLADYDKKYLYAIISVYVGFWTIYFIVVPSFDLIRNVHYILLMPLIFLSILTYFFLYKNKRVPEIHSLILAIAWILYLISSIIRPTILISIGDPPWGMSWVGEILDIINWIIMTLGFVIKPKYQ